MGEAKRSKEPAPLISDLARALPEEKVREIYRETVMEMVLANPGVARLAKKGALRPSEGKAVEKEKDNDKSR